ncbi:MAG: gliding motility lipoprotein GldH [Paramuribaculum sp.]|nr:gliding motility lipoprotein GldH [Paramuribaculum sp.]
MKPSILASVILLIASIACTDHYSAVGEFHTLSSEAFAYTDTIGFTLSNLDSIPGKNLYVAVVHSDKYPYCNLWLEVTYEDSLRKVCDTVALTMADQYGKWQGHALGSTFQIEAIACPEINPTGDSRVSVRHIMRTDTLHGIDRIGILAK